MSPSQPYDSNKSCPSLHCEGCVSAILQTLLVPSAPQQVVEKLSAIAAVHASVEQVLDTQAGPCAFTRGMLLRVAVTRTWPLQDMDEEDIGILSMLHGERTNRASQMSLPLDKENGDSLCWPAIPHPSTAAASSTLH